MDTHFVFWPKSWGMSTTYETAAPSDVYSFACFSPETLAPVSECGRPGTFINSTLRFWRAMWPVMGMWNFLPHAAKVQILLYALNFRVANPHNWQRIHAAEWPYTQVMDQFTIHKGTMYDLR